MNWGVINWGIPLEEFSDTHNGQPLCYVGLGAKKNYNSLYLMGVYEARTASTRRRSPRSAGRRLQESREAARHGEVLSPLQAARRFRAHLRREGDRMSTPKKYIAYYKRVKGLA